MMKWRPGRVVRVGGARGERRRAAATLAAGLLVATLAVGGAYAVLSSVPAPIVNVFDPAKVDVHIDEKLDDGVKSDVALANTGDVDAWMRATFAISWTDEGGNVVGRQPVENVDYTLELAQGENWLFGEDGLHYWALPVTPNSSTDTLVVSATLTSVGKKTAQSEGWQLRLDVLAAGLQAEPAGAFDQAWGPTSGLHVDGWRLAPGSVDDGRGDDVAAASERG